MTDLIDRLKEPAGQSLYWISRMAVERGEAAAEIERLRAEVKKFREMADDGVYKIVRNIKGTDMATSLRVDKNGIAFREMRSLECPKTIKLRFMVESLGTDQFSIYAHGVDLRWHKVSTKVLNPPSGLIDFEIEYENPKPKNLNQQSVT